MGQIDAPYAIFCATTHTISFVLSLWSVLTFLLIYQGGVQNLLAWSEYLRHLNDFYELRKAGIVYITSLSEFGQIISGPLFAFFSLSTIQSIVAIYRGYAFIPRKYALKTTFSKKHKLMKSSPQESNKNQM